MRDYHSARNRPRSKRKSKKISSSRSQKMSGISRVVGALLVWLFLMGVVTIVIFKFGSYYLADLIPLESSQNVLLVSGNLEEESKQLILARFSPRNNEVTVFELDENLEVELIGGYGRYKLGSVYPLLKLEGKDQHYIGASFSLALGMMIDQVVSIDSEDSLTAGDGFSQAISPFVFKQRLSYQQRLDLLRLMLFTKKAEAKWDEPLTDLKDLPARLARYNLESEQNLKTCSVTVVNTTNISGLATRVAELLETDGLLVVRITSIMNQLDKSQVVYDSTLPECAQVAEQVVQIIPSYSQKYASQEIATKYRAGTVVLLGSDFGSQ